MTLWTSPNSQAKNPYAKHEESALNAQVISVTGRQGPPVEGAMGNVVDLTSLSEFASGNQSGQWVEVDFKDHRIRPDYYTIQSHHHGLGYAHVKSWVIEVSNDCNYWREIDKEENNHQHNKPYGLMSFPFECDEFYQRIRVRQIGPSHQGDDILCMSAFEVFGRIDPPI